MRRNGQVDLAQDRIDAAHVDPLPPLAAVFEHAQMGGEWLRGVVLLTLATEVVNEDCCPRQSLVEATKQKQQLCLPAL